MTVYIEYVIIDNLVITGLISLMSYRVLKLSVNKIRVAAAAAVGTAAAVFYPFLHLHFLLLLLIKFALYIVLCLILFCKKTKLIKASAIFLLITAACAGSMFTVGFIILGDATAALTTPAYDFPLGLIILIPVVLYYITKRLVLTITKHRAAADYTYKFELKVLDKSYTAKGFLDSGNLLLDECTGLPVVIAGARLSARILDDKQFELVLRGQGNEICKSARYIKFGTLNKSSRILVLKAEKFRLYLPDGANIIKEVMLGLSFSDIGTEFDALLSPAIF